MGNQTQVVGQRVGAAVIDGALFVAAWVGLFLALAHRTSSGFTPNGAQAHVDSGGSTLYVTGGRFWLLQGAVLVIGFALYVLLPSFTGGTVGKLLVGIRVVTPDGSPAGLDKHLVRWLLLIVDDFPYVLPGLVGFVLVLSTQGHRRLGDLAAGTYVVRKDAVGQPVPGPGGAPSPPAAAAAPAGWYADPYGQARVRWWDGTRWTEHASA